MGALGYQLRSELRRSWRAALAVTLLVVLIGGAVMAAAAGARRTASAYPDLLRETSAEELLVSPAGEPGVDPSPIYDDIAALDGVRRVGLMAGLPILAMEGTPTGDGMESSANSEMTPYGIAMASLDGVAFTDVGRPALIAGRMPRPERTGEVLVSRRVARAADVRVGDRLDFVLAPNHADDVIVAGESMGRHLPVTVVGVGEFPSEVIPFGDLEATGTMLFTPAVARMVKPEERYFEGLGVDLEPGVDADAMLDQIRAIAAARPEAGGDTLFVVDRSANADQVTDGLRPLAVALAAFAVVLGVAGTFVVGQAAARHIRPRPGEALARRAIGTTMRDRLVLGTARAAVIATTGAVGAGLLAVALSDRFPIGPARLAETEPGIEVDVPVIATGMVVIVALVVISVIPSLVLGLRARASEHRRQPALVGLAANLGIRPAAAQGVRLAMGQRRGPTPARSTIVATAVASACVLAAATFATSLTTLVDSPDRYGQAWDRLVDGEFGPAPAGEVVDRIGGLPGVELAVGSFHQATVDGRLVPTISMRSFSGDTGTTVLRGRPATAAGEIALGGEVLEELGADIGDRVVLDGGDGPRPVEVVGEAVFPHFSQGSFGQTGLGFGAQVHTDELQTFFPAEEAETLPPGFELDGALYNYVVVEAGPSLDAVDAELDSLLFDMPYPFLVRDQQRPTTIADLDRVRSVPVALAVVLALAAAALVAHLLVSAVRSHRHELALLAALGFTRRQLRSTVSWQATLVVVLACAAGVPVGVAVGRSLWRSFAEGIHAPAAPVVPVWWVALALPVAVLLANAVAAVPGRVAARARPAVTLREE